MIGKVINKYRIDEKLGEGGMGLVYKAWDTVLERAVALKMINLALSQNEIFFKCFLAEAKTLAKLDHPHIVNVYDLIEHEHGWFIVMQYIEGQTLAQKLAHEGALPVPQAMALGKQILSALGYAHQAGIVHRDMKPSNIILTREQQVKVADLGLAKYQRGTVLTNTSATGGTPHYMSPEQVKNLAHVDHRSDIYAVGMTLYEMLAGKTPFPENAPPVDILNAILKNKFPPPSAQVATLPHTLDRLVLKAIAKAPEDRFQSAEAMAQVIDAFTRGEPTATALRTSASTRRRRMLLMAALVLFSALSCVLLIPSLRERIVGWFASPNKVPIAVHTQPAGATVFWGKERLGITPIARCVVNEGWTDLRFEREGYLTKDTTLFLADKILGMQPQPLPLIMLQPAAHVALAIQPEEAGVTIDQKPVDKSQWGKLALAAGAHTIFIVSEGHAPLLAQFTLVQGRNPSLVYRLTRTIVEPALGELTLTSDPSGAKIELKGAKNFQTKSPLKNFKLPSGPYRLNLTKEKYQTYHETVHIDSGQVTTLPPIKLQPMPGRLNLTIVPRGTIYVDQKLFGENTDRFESDLLAGTHYLNIVALDAASVFWADSIRIKPAEEFKKRLDFNQQFDVRIVAVDAAHEPLAGARISVDGVWRKHTTPANFKLRFGHHALMVHMEGYEILQPAWQSNLESKTKIEFRLKRAQ